MEVRSLAITDMSHIFHIYKEAFHCPPWHEDLSDSEVHRRLGSQLCRDGFAGLVGEVDPIGIVTAVWWDTPTIATLIQERGEELAEFAQKMVPPNPDVGARIVWERELITDPELQGRGFASKIRSAFIAHLRKSGPYLVLTRMRDDNSATVHIAEKLGYQKTGITVPCTLHTDKFHDYWYLLIN